MPSAAIIPLSVHIANGIVLIIVWILFGLIWSDTIDPPEDIFGVVLAVCLLLMISEAISLSLGLSVWQVVVIDIAFILAAVHPVRILYNNDILDVDDPEMVMVLYFPITIGVIAGVQAVLLIENTLSGVIVGIAAVIVLSPLTFFLIIYLNEYWEIPDWLSSGACLLALALLVWFSFLGGWQEFSKGEEPSAQQTMVDPSALDSTFAQQSGPRPPITALGDTLDFVVVAAQEVERIYITRDEDVRRPYWIEQGRANAYPALDRIIIEDKVDQIQLLVEGYVYPTDRVDAQGRLVITRDSVQAFLDTVTTLPVRLPVAPDTIRLFTSSRLFTYRVRAGETLAGIAIRHNVSVEAIVSANSISDRDLYRLVVGQILYIPSNQ